VTPGQRLLHDQLLEAANQLFERGDTDEPDHWAAAIVVAGNASDVAAAHTLACLRHEDMRRSTPRLRPGEARKLDALLKSRKTVNLRTKGQRALWRSLTGSKLSQWPDWIEYLRHVDRRDTLVHRGQMPGGRQPTRADAKDSLEVTRSFCQHLANVTRSTAPRT